MRLSHTAQLAYLETPTAVLTTTTTASAASSPIAAMFQSFPSESSSKLSLEEFEECVRKVQEQHPVRAPRSNRWQRCADPRWRSTAIGDTPPLDATVKFNAHSYDQRDVNTLSVHDNRDRDHHNTPDVAVISSESVKESEIEAGNTLETNLRDIRVEIF